MRQIKITCDKCKKEIVIHDNVESVDLSRGYKFDFCPTCYSSFIKSVGDWMQKKEN